MTAVQGSNLCQKSAPHAGRGLRYEQYLADYIDLFEEYGWDWTYHAFRKWDGWSAEHSTNPDDKTRYESTPHMKLLTDYMSRNRKWRLTRAGNAMFSLANFMEKRRYEWTRVFRPCRRLLEYNQHHRIRVDRRRHAALHVPV
ncbi:MAG: hypothetical protein V8T86_07075 [Victivallis sp.]